jgi:site-specific DNA recombinase
VDPVTDKLVAHPNEATILREIFGLYATSGVGTRALATALNERGLRTRSGRPWSGLTIGRMLTNRTYLGELNYRTVSVPDAHLPLIDAALYAEVQRIFASRSNVRPVRAASHSDYHLTGLIICPECGQKYVGTSAHGRRRVYRYYTCVRRSRYGPAGCTAPRLQADIADELILAALVDFYADSGLIADAANAAQQQRDTTRTLRREELATVQRELGNVASALDRYLIAFELGSLDEATCSHRVRALQERARQLTNRQRQVTARGDQPAPPPDCRLMEQIRHQLAAILRAGTPAQRKAVIEAHVAEIRVAHGTITPVFKLPAPTPPA